MSGAFRKRAALLLVSAILSHEGRGLSDESYLSKEPVPLSLVSRPSSLFFGSQVLGLPIASVRPGGDAAAARDWQQILEFCRSNKNISAFLIDRIQEWWAGMQEEGRSLSMSLIRNIIVTNAVPDILLKDLKSGEKRFGFVEFSDEELDLLNSRQIHSVTMLPQDRQAFNQVLATRFHGYEELRQELLKFDRGVQRDRVERIDRRISRVRKNMAEYLNTQRGFKAKSANSLANLPDARVHEIIREDILTGEAVAYDLSKGLLKYLHPRWHAPEQARSLQQDFWNLPPRAHDRLSDFLLSLVNHNRLVNGLTFLDQICADEPLLSTFRYVVLLRRRTETFRADFLGHAGRRSIYLPLDLLELGWAALSASPESQQEKDFNKWIVYEVVQHLYHERFHLSGKKGIDVVGHSYSDTDEWQDTLLLWGHYSRYMISKLHEPSMEMPLEEALVRLSLLAKEGIFSSVMIGLPDPTVPEIPMWSMTPKYAEASLEMIRGYLKRGLGRKKTPYRFSLRFSREQRSEEKQFEEEILRASRTLAEIFGFVRVTWQLFNKPLFLANLVEKKDHVSNPPTLRRNSS